MSKIKPYHEPLEAKAYVLEVKNATNLPLDKTSTNCINGFIDTNHHIGESSFSCNKRELRKFHKGQKVVRRYMPYKQKAILYEQQKWMGPYTITKVHDDNTIQIENKYQKDLGRWRSNTFLLYDSVNSDQVISFDQNDMKV